MWPLDCLSSSETEKLGPKADPSERPFWRQQSPPMIPKLPEDIELKHETANPNRGRCVPERSGHEDGALTYRSAAARADVAYSFVDPGLRGELGAQRGVAVADGVSRSNRP
jgi:hypothetical protein